ncbi:hypothetical protein FNF27_07379 [Cafeteria roenbergensis]|uniref:Uncharacterized protein n=1 Tax=Cafeteria roenbergensis TaxID=33653 RepID=A0A5A8DTC1_CAFRO|nr:hypothetical protein FNF27_07379 [Cafeteria roenbergensis]
MRRSDSVRVASVAAATEHRASDPLPPRSIADVIRADFDALRRDRVAVLADEEAAALDVAVATRGVAGQGVTTGRRAGGAHGQLAAALMLPSASAAFSGGTIRPRLAAEVWRSIARDPASASAALRVLIGICTDRHARQELARDLKAAELAKSSAAVNSALRKQAALEAVVHAIQLIGAAHATPRCTLADGGRLERAIGQWREALEAKGARKRGALVSGESLACALLARRVSGGDDSLRLLVIHTLVIGAGSGPTVGAPGRHSGRRRLLAPSPHAWALPLVAAETRLGLRSEAVWDTGIALLLQMPSVKQLYPGLARSAARAAVMLLTSSLHSSPVPDPGFLLEALPPLAALVLAVEQPLAAEAAALATLVETEAVSPGFGFRRALFSHVPGALAGSPGTAVRPRSQRQ